MAATLTIGASPVNAACPPCHDAVSPEARPSRRDFLRTACAAMSSVVAVPVAHIVATRRPTLVIRGGRALVRGAWHTGDVGVTTDGRIVLGAAALDGDRIFDARGLVVSAGFVDLLADHGPRPDLARAAFEHYKLTDGVTTALQMHGGSEDVAAYHTACDRLPHRINYGVSTFVMRIRDHRYGLAARVRAVERGLEQGALGVSHSIEYRPTAFEELVAYGRLAQRFDRPYFLHLRYSDTARELDGVREAIELARLTSAHVHVDHLNSTGGTWHMREALDLLGEAIHCGARMTTCVYPFSYWATYLASRRFAEGWQQRYGITYGDLEVAGTGERLTARSFARYRTGAAVLVAVPPGAMPLDRTFDLAIREPFCFVGSDGGITREDRPDNHPRGASCYAAALERARQIGMPLEELLPKLNERPAAAVGEPMRNRGVIADGAIADLCVFDPLAVAPRATIAEPARESAGIRLVVVRGAIAFENGVLGAPAGTAIRGR